MNSLLVLPSIPPTTSCAISTTQNRHHDHVLSERVYFPPEIYTHPAALLLESCTSLPQLRRILPQIIKHDLYAQHLFQTKLIISKHGGMTEAARVFESVEDGDRLDVLYQTTLKGYVKISSLRDSLSFFVRMKRDEVRHVVYNFSYLLKACGDEANLKRGKEIHGQLVVSGFS